jgi:uncharacterized YigZ family protein
MRGERVEDYTTLKGYGTYSYEEKKSVFIGECMPVKSENEALSFINNIKKKYSDARHHVYAYILKENSIMRFSDDHEPQGTAGLPVLDSMRKKGIVDAVVVVTRYFGGTLLGTGGLVRAYTEAAVGAVEEANVITFTMFRNCSIEVSYSDYQKIQTVLSSFSFRTEQTDYRENVTIEGRVLLPDEDALFEAISEQTGGRATCLAGDAVYDF